MKIVNLILVLWKNNVLEVFGRVCKTNDPGYAIKRFIASDEKVLGLLAKG